MNRDRQLWRVATCALLAAGCGGAAHAELPARAPIEVRVTRVEETSVRPIRAVGGNVRARRQAVLAPLVSGRIEAVYVERGDAVREGQALLQLRDVDRRDVAALAWSSLESARLRSPGDVEQAPELVAAAEREALATGELERAEALFESGSVSEQELRRLRAERDAARALLDSTRNEARAARATLTGARAQLALERRAVRDAVLRAPFSGRVVSRSGELGEVVQAGAPLVTLVEDGPLRVLFEASEELARSLHDGDALDVLVGSDRCTARVLRRSAALDDVSHTQTVEAELAEDAAAVGALVTVEVPLGHAASAVRVPLGALTEMGGVRRVFVVRGDHAEERLVVLARTEGDTGVLTRGLAPGDLVVVDPPASLRDGDGVRVTSEGSS